MSDLCMGRLSPGGVEVDLMVELLQTEMGGNSSEVLTTTVFEAQAWQLGF